MVVVVIAGILASIAYPAFTSALQRGRRADAIKVLTAIVQAQERLRSNRTAYTSDFGTSHLAIDTSALTPYYDFEVVGIGTPPSLVSGYVASAKIKTTGAQSTDTNCAKLSVQMNGAMLTYVASNSVGLDTSASCWPK
jgi:type IV pilus assembly protein PilE